MKWLSRAVLWLSVALLFPGMARTQDTGLPPGAAEVQRNIEYAKVGDKSLTLDLYLPKDAVKPMPVVVWVHGGGWRAGSKENVGIILPMLPSGIAVASINYRLSQEAVFPAQIYDCKAAVRWVRAHAADYGLNPDKIGAGGDSAGGHLAALLGTTAGNHDLEGDEGNPGVSSQVQAVVDFYGPTNFVVSKENPVSVNADTNSMVTGLLGGTDPEKAKAASPLYYVTAQACPFYIVHGDHDLTVPLQHSIDLNAALQKAGVASTLYVIKGGGHGYNDPTSTQAMVDFFRHYLLSLPAGGETAKAPSGAKL